MSGIDKKILIMAGGTGGHIFPALSIAEKLNSAGISVEWLGAVDGLEIQLISSRDIPLHLIAVRGLRGKGLTRWLMAPFMVTRAVLQALKIMKKVKPDCVLGMGGFVTGPGGLAAWLSGRKLLIHEQNAIPGMTNKLLSVIASGILEGFPGTFKQQKKVKHTGNPVRESILTLGESEISVTDRKYPLHLLVLGGSQGAASINHVITEVLASWEGEQMPQVIHQTGNSNLSDTTAAYRNAGLQPGDEIQISGFIDDMAQVFSWADLVICRSGASTVCELAAAGLPSVLIPYPYHKDNQQLKNAQWLSKAGAALVLEQSELSSGTLLSILQEFNNNRDKLIEMAKAAKSLANPYASEIIADYCQETASV